MKVKYVKPYEVKVNTDNPRIIKDTKFDKLIKSVKDLPQMLKMRPIIVNDDMIILGGNMRYQACIKAGIKQIPIIQYTKKEHLDLNTDKTYEETCEEIIIKDNVGFGEWDWDILANEWNSVELDNWGLDVWVNDDEKPKHNKLQDSFVISPFTILDSRQGYWKERKSAWHELIKDKGESRQNKLTGIMSGTNNGVSLLDPVLAEICNKWFGLENCNTFDCFAGDSVFGFVSDYMGNKFTGIELRQEQTDLNNSRLKGSKSKYICDDGQNVLKHIKANTQDLLFSCPPYFDLEVYSELKNDASNQKEYADFLKILDTAFSNSIKCLKDNRFAFIVVGDLRDKNGAYYNFPNDIKNIFIKNNMILYNEMVLVEPLGTLPQRVRRYMINRKVGKCHQNVLVFYKGDTKEISNIYKEINLTIDES
tara:strand:+ start:2615 stop:3877 length:1263 start_codon:yes stop_codon:yes gene_type:complete